MKPKHQRLAFISVSMVFLCAAALLTLGAFRDNVVYFYAPSELAEKAPAAEQHIRLGGLVDPGSVARDGDTLRFTLTDGQASVSVSYRGMPPALFREGQGAVVEGALNADGQFRATRVLTKHDENYMPPEVAAALKKTGRWKNGKGIGD